MVAGRKMRMVWLEGNIYLVIWRAVEMVVAGRQVRWWWEEGR